MKPKRSPRQAGRPPLPVGQVAAELSLDKKTIYNMVHRGLPRIPAEPMKLDLATVLTWLEDMATREPWWADQYVDVARKHQGLHHTELAAARESPIGVSVSQPVRLQPPRPRTARKINPTA